MELLLPRACAGCGEAGHVLCPRCRNLLARVPQRVYPAVDTHVPVFSLGPYAEAHRGVILAAKERGNQAVRRLVGAVLGAGIRYLQAAGELTHDVVLVPAPTRRYSATMRGGDPVTALCRTSGIRTVELLRLRSGTSDQTELGVAGRRANMAGKVQLLRTPPTEPLVLIDDVVTTGATLGASVERLLVTGARVQAAVVISHA